jgi:hypothetical protein
MTEFLVWFGIMVVAYVVILAIQLTARVGEKLFNYARRRIKGTF